MADLELPDDPTTHPYWTAALEGRLVLQVCDVCGSVQLYPRPVCLGCFGRELSWRESAARGTVYSMTTVLLPVADVPPPYQVALVDLDEGPRVLGFLSGAGVAIGTRVLGRWESREVGLPRLTFVRS